MQRSPATGSPCTTWWTYESAAPLRSRRPAGGRGRASRDRSGRLAIERTGLGARAVLLLYVVPCAKHRLPSRPPERSEHFVPAAARPLRRERIRDQTGLLHVQEWPACADVRDHREESEARRDQSDAADRVWRVRHQRWAQLPAPY